MSALKNSKPTKPLRGLSDIRRFFYRNETPIYFISATNFNLLGADEWVKGFKFISLPSRSRTRRSTTLHSGP